MVPSEASYVHWISNCIERYFKRIGFEIITLMSTTRKEKLEPFDTEHWITNGDMVKRFGLQVKRPHTNKELSWRLQKDQHNKLHNFQWVMYAFPDFIDIIFSDVACIHTIFKPTNFTFKPILRRSEVGYYYRWGSVAERVLDCRIGIRLTSDNVYFIFDLPYEWRTLVYDINLTSKKVLCFKPSSQYEPFNSEDHERRS